MDQILMPVVGDIAKSAINMSSEDQLLRNDALMVSVPPAPEIEIIFKQEVVEEAAALLDPINLPPAPVLIAPPAGEGKPHALWKHAGEGGKLKYTNVNIYHGKGVSKADTRREGIPGIEVRDLGPGHVLAGEQGLFATKRFEQFSVVAEYCGRVVPKTQGGHYVANLEEKEYTESVGVDAEECGNEMRFINAYQGISDGANVKMVVAYIASYPHLIIICKKDIEIGEEFLLDYGDDYTNMYLRPKEVRVQPMVCWGELPCGDVTDEDDI